MICPRCAHELEAGQSLCSYCGFVLLNPSEGWPAVGMQDRQEHLPPGRQVSSRQNFTNKNEASMQNPSPSFLSQNQQYNQRAPLHATHFTTNTISQGEAQKQNIAQSSLKGATPVPGSLEAPIVDSDSTLSPGTLLRESHYRINDRRSYQKWSGTAYETHWDAQDLSQQKADVLICEIGLSGTNVVARQANLRAAMRSLFSASTHAQVPTLTNVFRESGRDFFVFNTLEGESLLQRLQREQRLSEQEVIECCLQITEVLEAISSQDPPLVHGFINPENIQRTRSGRWGLTDFSVILASGAPQYYSDVDHSSLFSPFTSPDFAEGTIDPRLDIYSLLASAYYAVTGDLPRRTERDPLKGELLNARVSSSFGTIFMKGLHPLASQRYQYPSALRQDLLSLRPAANTPSVSINRQEGINNASLQWSAPLQDSRQESLNRTMMSSPGRERSNPYQQRISNEPIDPYRQEEQKRPPSQSTYQGRQPIASGTPKTVDPVTKAFSSLDFSGDVETPANDLLPQPEELPPISRGRDALVATLWMIGILICLLIPVIVK